MKNVTHLIQIFCFFFFGIYFFNNEIIAQNCNPDLESPILFTKSLYTVNLDQAANYRLEATELVTACADNCTSFGNLRFSFSQNVNDFEKLISRNDPFPMTLTVYATDASGNYTSQNAQFQIAKCTPSMVCNDLINITINPGEQLSVDPDLFLEGSWCYDHNFKYEYFDANHQKQALNLIDELLPKSFQYLVTDLNTGNSCWGNVNLLINSVCDPKKRFEFQCSDIIVQCAQEIRPEFIGYPWPSHYLVDAITSPNKYLVTYETGCPYVKVIYEDENMSFDCNNSNAGQINRKWTAFLAGTETITCTQKIIFNRSATKLFANLRNYDNIDLPSLNCNDNWARDSVNTPSPLYTGIPVVSNVCANYMSYKYEDNILIAEVSGCGLIYKVIRHWTVYNWCTSESFQHDQVIKVNCSSDSISPVAICFERLSGALNPFGEFLLNASDADAGSYDNCSAVKFSFDPNGRIVSKKFTQADLGSISLQLYVTDQSGNQNSCIFTLDLQEKGTKSNYKHLVGGVYRNYHLQPIVSPTKIVYTINDNTHPLASCANPLGYPNLNYSVCVDTAAHIPSGYLQPRIIVNNPLNGVSTYDFVQVVKRMFGISIFNKYEEIAADVNCDNHINLFDLFDMRKLILGIDTKFSCPNDVAFYNTDISNPKLIKDLELTGLPRFDIDIVPVKKGDINGNSIYFGKENNEKRSNLKFSFTMDDFEMVNGNVYDIWMRANQAYNIYGMQLGQIFDPSKIEILELSSPYLNLSKNNDYIINSRDWRGLLLSSEADLFKIENGFLRIKVLAKENGNVKDAIFANSYPFPLFVIGDDVELSEPTIVIKTITDVHNITDSNQMMIDVSPNPFSGDLNYSLYSGNTNQAQVQIFDLDGKCIYSEFIDDFKNQTQRKIKSEVFQHIGVYILNIKSNNTTTQQKIIKQ